jgi:hypothetical protein
MSGRDWLIIIYGVSFCLYFVNCRIKTNSAFPSCAEAAIASTGLIISVVVFGFIGWIMGALRCEQGHFMCPQLTLGLRAGQWVGFGIATAAILFYAVRSTAARPTVDRETPTPPAGDARKRPKEESVRAALKRVDQA